MAFMFQRRLAIPLWTFSLCVIILAWPARPPAIAALLAIALLGSMALLLLRWLGTPSLHVATMPSVRGLAMTGATAGAQVRVLHSGAHAQVDNASEALDLVRMDDDGGWRMPSEHR